MPSNHYLPRRRVEIKLSEDQLVRPDSPHKIDALPPGKRPPTLDDASSFLG